jgi:hypothetical protein
MSESNVISFPNSRKYFLQFTLPGGQRMATTEFEGKFALLPIFENKVEGQILVWDTPRQVYEFVQEMKKNFSPEDFKELWSMRPEILPINTALESRG